MSLEITTILEDEIGELRVSRIINDKQARQIDPERLQQYIQQNANAAQAYFDTEDTVNG